MFLVLLAAWWWPLDRVQLRILHRFFDVVEENKQAAPVTGVWAPLHLSGPPTCCLAPTCCHRCSAVDEGFAVGCRPIGRVSHHVCMRRGHRLYMQRQQGRLRATFAAPPIAPLALPALGQMLQCLWTMRLGR